MSLYFADINTGWIKDLRRLIELLKNTVSEKVATVKEGAERRPSFKKMIDHMISVTQCIQKAFAFWTIV